MGGVALGVGCEQHFNLHIAHLHPLGVRLASFRQPEAAVLGATRPIAPHPLELASEDSSKCRAVDAQQMVDVASGSGFSGITMDA